MGYLDSFIGSAAVPEDVLRTSANSTAAVGALTDATQTITVAHGKQRTVPSSMAADRVYTLGTSGAAVGDTISVRRPTGSRYASTFVNGGAGGGRWVAKSAGLYVYRFDGTNWAQVAAPATNGEVHLNVRDFGAVGDGVTNDTAAIQSALAALPDGGGEVYFPPGQYLVSDNLLVQRNGTRVYGAGARMSQLYGPTTWVPTDSARMTQPALLFLIAHDSNGHDSTLIENVVVHDLGFYGCMTLSPGGTGVMGVIAAAAKNVVVRNCRFEHFAMPGVYQNNNAGSKWIVSKNEFYLVGTDGLGGLGSPAAINIAVNDTVVDGNFLDACQNPIGITHCSNVTVSNNVVRNPVVYGISVGDDAAHPTENVVVVGNTIQADVPSLPASPGTPLPLYAIYVVAGSRSVTISGNSVTLKTVTGSSVNARAILAKSSSGLMINNNTITVDFNSLTIPLHGIAIEPDADTDVAIHNNFVRGVNEPGSSFQHAGISALANGHTLNSNVSGNRVIGFTSSLSGYAYALHNQGAGGTHRVTGRGNSSGSDGILRLVGYTDLNPGIASHSLDFQTAGATAFGPRSRYPSPSQTIDAAGDTIDATGAELIRISNATGGSITLTSAPTIASGADGQTITLINLGTQNVVLQDQGTLASSNLRLTATTITLGPRQSVELTYLSSVGDWVQTGPVVAVL